MAATWDDVLSFEKLKLQWRNIWRDPSYLIFLVVFVVGGLSILASINTTFPILGPLFTWLRGVLYVVGPLLRGFLSILILVLIFQLAVAFMTRQLDAIGFIPGWLLLSFLIWFLVLFAIYLPQLLGAGQPGNVFASQSIIDFVSKP